MFILDSRVLASTQEQTNWSQVKISFLQSIDNKNMNLISSTTPFSLNHSKCFIPIQTDRGKQGRHKNYCRKIFSRRQRDKSETKMHKTDRCMKWRIDHDIPLIANDLRERNPNKIRKLNYFVIAIIYCTTLFYFTKFKLRQSIRFQSIFYRL